MTERVATERVGNAPTGFGVRRWSRSWLPELISMWAFTAYIAWPFVRPSRYLTGFDTYAYAGPNLKVTLDALRHLRVPAWNSMVFGGAPHLANSQSGALYPPKLLVLPFDVGRGIGLLVAMHLFLLATGMVVLVRRLGLRAPAGLVAGLVVIGGGATQYRAIQFEQILVVAWVPWVLIGIDSVVRGRKPRAASVATAGAATMMFLAGHPQMVFMAVPLAAAFAFGRAADGARWSRLGYLAFSGLLAGLLCAPQLLPTLAATSRSALTDGRSLTAVANPAYNIDPARLPETLAGLVTSANPIAEAGSAEAAGYLGASGIALAVVGAAWMLSRRSHRWTGATLTACAVVSILLALGPRYVFYRAAFDVVPGVDQARVPGRWVTVLTFAAGLLAAYGVEAIRTGISRRATATAAVVTAVLALVIVAGPTPVPPAARLVLWGTAAALPLCARGLRLAPGRWMLTALLVPVLVVGAELGTAASKSPARSTLQPVSFTGYHGPLVDAMAGRPGRVLSLAFDRFDNPRYLTSTLRPNANALFGLRSVDGYDGGLQVTDRWVSMIQALAKPDAFDEELTLRSQILLPLDADQMARLGVRWALVETSVIPPEAQVPGWRGPLAAEGAVQLWENPAWQGEGRQWFAAEPMDEADMPPRLATRDRNDRDVLFVDRSDDAPSVSCGTCTARGVDLERPHDGLVRATVDGDRASVVTLSEQFDPGWRVTVDGRKVSTLAADGFTLAVSVPAGTHLIVARYRAPGFATGVVLAVLGVLLVAVALVPSSTRLASSLRRRPLRLLRRRGVRSAMTDGSLSDG